MVGSYQGSVHLLVLIELFVCGGSSSNYDFEDPHADHTAAALEFDENSMHDEATRSFESANTYQRGTVTLTNLGVNRLRHARVAEAEELMLQGYIVASTTDERESALKQLDVAHKHLDGSGSYPLLASLVRLRAHKAVEEHAKHCLEMGRYHGAVEAFVAAFEASWNYRLPQHVLKMAAAWMKDGDMDSAAGAVSRLWHATKRRPRDFYSILQQSEDRYVSKYMGTYIPLGLGCPCAT